MPNILLTTECNRECPYCFARMKVHTVGDQGPGIQLESDQCSDGRNYITSEAFGMALDFLTRSGDTYVGLLGGEPTLHPQFKEMLEQCLDAGFRTSIFSNGLMSPAVARFVADVPGNVLAAINLNHPSETPVTQWECAQRTLSILGRRARLSYNVYQPDPCLDFLVDTVRAHDLDLVIRVGLAMPILGRSNTHLALSGYPDVGRKLAEFTGLCAEHDIRLELDCGFVLCMFSPHDIGRMRYNGTNVITVCEPVIDIGPDLRAWACFPLSGGENVQLRDFENTRQLRTYFAERSCMWKKIGASAPCLHCPHLRRNQCTGGCIAHIINSFEPKSPGN